MSGEEGRATASARVSAGGALAGWRAGQIITVAVGLVFGVLVLRWEPNALGRRGGHRRPRAVRRAGDRAGVGAHRRRVAAGGGVLGRPPGRRPRGAADGRVARRAPAAGRLARHGRGARPHGRTLTAALSLRGRSFALLGADEQDRRVGAWASVLSSLAREGSPVHRVQWVAASFPDDGKGVRSYLASEAAPDAASACTASYDALLTDMDSHTWPTTCCWPCRCGSPGRSRSAAPPWPERSARSSGSWPTPTWRWSRCSRPTTWPTGCSAPTSRQVPAGTGVGLVADPWPMAMEERWSSVRVDAMVHATFWVAEWPRTGCAATSWLRCCSARHGRPCPWSWSPWAPTPRYAGRRPRARPTWPTPSSVGAAGSSRPPATPGSPRSWPDGRPNWPRATPRSVFRVTSRCRPPATRSSRPPATGAARGRPEPPGAAEALRRSGVGLHLHPAVLPRPAMSRGQPSAPPTMTPWPRIDTVPHVSGIRSPTQSGCVAARQPEPSHAGQLRRHGVRDAASRSLRSPACRAFHVARHGVTSLHAGTPRSPLWRPRLSLAPMGVHRVVGRACHGAAAAGRA